VNNQDGPNSLPEPQIPTDFSVDLGGFDGDLERMLGHASDVSTERDVPIAHPGDDISRTAEISDDEYQKIMADKMGPQQLFKTNHKLRAKYGVFNLSKEEECQALENMVNNCLQKGWLLAREEWRSTPEGGTIVSMKCLIPEKKNRRGRKKKR
jgi:hypothetical protein